MSLICAPDFQALEEPTVFLAGPIQGADPWQFKLSDMLLEQTPQINVCSPRRREGLSADWNDAAHAEQVDWEWEYLNAAADSGVVAFWLAAQYFQTPGRPYAQTTRWELGWWMAQAAEGKCKLAVGFDEGFTNARYLRRKLEKHCPLVPVSESLEVHAQDILALLAK